MYDRRKSKRLPIKLNLTITSLFKQDNLKISGLNEDIEVINISKSGIGFKCKQELPTDYYFDANIELTGGKHFFCVLRIVRIEKQEEDYYVGCEFVGLADILTKSVDDYELEKLKG